MDATSNFNRAWDLLSRDAAIAAIAAIPLMVMPRINLTQWHFSNKFKKI